MAAGTLLVHDGDAESKALSQLGTLTLNPALDAGMLALGNDLLLRWQELQPAIRQRLARELLVRITPAAAVEPGKDDEVADATLQLHVREALSGRKR